MERENITEIDTFYYEFAEEIDRNIKYTLMGFTRTFPGP